MNHKRRRICFDRDWLFHKGDIPVKYAVKAGMTGGITDCGKLDDGEWLDIAFVDRAMDSRDIPSDWSEVNVPHDWCVEGQYVNDPDLGSRPGSHGYLPTGIGYYRKLFDLEADHLGSRIRMEFEGIMGFSTIWVNGHLIGNNASGYNSFGFDITDVLRYGNEGRNVITVRVDARECEGWWYEGCGIYRHVWLECYNPVHVAPYGTYITTSVISEAEATVTMDTCIQNETSADTSIELTTKLLDDSGVIAAVMISTAYIPWYNTIEVRQEIRLEAPDLWSIEQPNLYTAVTQVSIDGTIKDEYYTTFGIRSIRFDRDTGFYLNGKHVRIQGVCAHQDFAGVGVALPDSLIAYKLKLLKEMGCNAYRSAHHPASPKLLELCDRMGILVLEENRKLDSSSAGLALLENMIIRDRNHPCIMMWGMENEEILEGTVMGARILKTMADFTRRLDPTRPTVVSMNHGWNEGGYSNSVDIVGYNYGQRMDQDVRDKERYPDRLMIGSESASFTTTRGIYEDDPELGYCSSYGTNIPAWGCSPEKAWGDVIRYPYLSGVFLWTGFDYRGEPTPYEWPCIHSHFGIMDICGFPKDIYHYIRVNWTEQPMVHVFPHWNWKGREGQPVVVWSYTNCDEVELFLNGSSLGRKCADRLGHLEWVVPYSPGALEAIGYIDGHRSAIKCVETSGPAYKLLLEPDRDSIFGDGQDVVPVRVSAVDQKGRHVPLADQEIRFRLEGGGRIIGVGNGNPSSHEPDKASRRRLFNGYALVLVQSSGSKETIRLNASSSELMPADLRLEVQK